MSSAPALRHRWVDVTTVVINGDQVTVARLDAGAVDLELIDRLALCSSCAASTICCPSAEEVVADANAGR